MPIKLEDASLLPESLRVFYAWQSDRTETRTILRKCLAKAVKRSQKELPIDANCNVFVDEAARGVAGSPDIPQAIYNKIKNSGIVVADVTIVAKSPKSSTTQKNWWQKIASFFSHKKKEYRCFPNPNSLGEATYAAGSLSWDRVIMAMDIAFGNPEDLPFDINHRTVVTFDSSQGANNENDQRMLEGLLYVEMRQIIQQLASNATLDDAASEGLKKDRDRKTLIRVLSTLDSSRFDLFFEKSQERIFYSDFLFLWFGFVAEVDSSRFHLHDNQLETLFVKVRSELGTAINIACDLFHAGINSVYSSVRTGEYWTNENQRQLDEFVRSAAEAYKTYRELLSLVQQRFPDLDIDETDQEASRTIAPYLKQARPAS